MERAKTRKPHKKSRNGCLPCKGRHCDEQKPNCANCVKQGTVCEYRPRSRRDTSNSNASPLPAAGTPVYMPSGAGTPMSSGDGMVFDQTVSNFNTMPMNGAPVGPDLTLNIAQMRLLHHYMTVTAKSIAANTKAAEVLADTTVQISFSHMYLLQSILALSALHMSRLVDSEEKSEYLYQADSYHEASLNNFQVMVSDIDEINWKAVLLFAGTLFPHACVATTAVDDLDHAFDNVLSNLVLTRRIRPMISRFYTEMKESELGRMIPDDVANMDWITAEQPANTELVQLRKFSEVVHHVYPPDIVDAYGYAIHLLELVFKVADESPKPPSDALLKIFIHFVSDRYVELLSERQPGSLIIFAHYAVIMRRAEHYWFLEGVAEQILRIAEYVVPGEWKAWLNWPKQQIRGGSGSVPTTPFSNISS